MLSVCLSFVCHVRRLWRSASLRNACLSLLGVTVVCGLVSVAAAEQTMAADPAHMALVELRAADRARSALAQEQAVWDLEHARLQALIVATVAEGARLEREATHAETDRDQAQAELVALGTGSDVDAVRAALTDGGTQARAALARVSGQTLPGAIPAVGEVSGEGIFDAVVGALEVAERAASEIAVEVITGQREGSEDNSSETPAQAVKILRIAGAAAWWVALDGSAAGTVTMRDGVVYLTAVPEAQAQAIASALAQAEGRQPAGVVVLPAPAAASGGAP